MEKNRGKKSRKVENTPEKTVGKNKQGDKG